MSATYDRIFDSLTGFDEIAIARSFGTSIVKMKEEPFTSMRALLFVQARRDGMKDVEAHEHAMAMPLREVIASFPDTDDDLEDLEADEGKAT